MYLLFLNFIICGYLILIIYFYWCLKYLLRGSSCTVTLLSAVLHACSLRMLSVLESQLGDSTLLDLRESLCREEQLDKPVLSVLETLVVNLLLDVPKALLKLPFIRNSPKVKEEFVVYRYSCNKEPCNGTQSYVGYTTTLLSTRMGFHAQQGFIRKHHMETHHEKITKQEILLILQ